MRLGLASIALFAALPAVAWNATGHRIAAAIAYERLTPKARAHVDELLRHHPDYATILTRDSPPDPEARARAAFLAASVWPDTVRSDPRFYDDAKADALPTPHLPGFPDMKKHLNWHYLDIPYSPEGVPAKVEPPPTALSELERILKEIAKPINDPVNPSYELPWLLHLEQDVHQPLHTVSRFLKSQPMGDAGGNNVYFQPAGVPANGRLYRTLHSVWDDLAGNDTSDAYVTRMAGEIAAEYAKSNRKLPKEPKKWVAESYRLATSSVYTFGPVTGTKETPLPIPQNYESDARRIARVQLGAAGFRMAAVLNALFN